MGMLFTSVMKLLEFANPDDKDKHRPVVGMRVVSVKIGDHCYDGLCDRCASVSAIPSTYIKKL